MASRVLRLFHKQSLQTRSYIHLVQDSLSNKNTCLYRLTTVLQYSTSNSQQTVRTVSESLPILERESVNKSKNVNNVTVEGGKIASHILMKEKGFLPIYKLQIIPLFTAVHKVKWQQLFVSSACIPVTFYCASIGLCPTVVPIAVLTIGSVTTSTLWIFGALFRRVVGIILVSPDCKTLCISYVDNKGRRQDDIFPTNDLVPLSDSASQKYTNAWWVLLQRYSSLEKELEPYKLLVQNCDITDENRFMQVFGSLL